MKNINILLGIVVVLLIMVAQCVLSETNDTLDDEIARAKNIHYLETLATKASAEIYANNIINILKGKDIYLKTIAILLVDKYKPIEQAFILKKIKENNNSAQEDIATTLLHTIDEYDNTPSEAYNNGINKLKHNYEKRIYDEFAIMIYCKHNIINYIPSKRRNGVPEISCSTQKDIESLPEENKMKKAYDILKNWKTVGEYEGAMNMIISDCGNKCIPHILEYLIAQDNIPTNVPPPYSLIHTNYYIHLLLLKSIPDERSIPVLQNLSECNNEYVAKNAKEILRWVKSGIPYPYKYNRILLIALDEL